MSEFNVGDKMDMTVPAQEHQTSQVPLLKSPARLLAHLQQNKNCDEQLRHQLIEAAQWILTSPEAIGFYRFTALCYDIPTKLQDGPQCGLVALWMASVGLIKCVANKSKGYTIGASDDQGTHVREHIQITESEESLDFHHDKFPSVEWIQNAAVARQFSRKGEMFSSSNLVSLAKDCFDKFLGNTVDEVKEDLFSAIVIRDDVYSLLTSYEKMLEFFTNPDFHQVMLVPYDSDYDQRPCNKRGHKSHWCVISGMATFVSHKKLTNIKVLNPSTSDNNNTAATVVKESQNVIDDSSKILIVCKNKMMPNTFYQNNQILKEEIFEKQQKQTKMNSNSYCMDDEEDEDCFYLVAKQSKSKRLFLFEPKQLAGSNRNLAEVSPERGFALQNESSSNYYSPVDRYVIPPGGLKEGLASQVVVLKMRV